MKQFISEITIEEMIIEVQREIAMRRKVYPRFVVDGKMRESQANLQILKLEAVLSLLQQKQKEDSPQTSLF